MRRSASDNGEDQNVPLKSVITCCWRFDSLSECTLHSPPEKSSVTLPRNYEIRNAFFNGGWLCLPVPLVYLKWVWVIWPLWQGRGTSWPPAQPGPVHNLGCVPCPSWGCVSPANKEPWMQPIRVRQGCLALKYKQKPIIIISTALGSCGCLIVSPLSFSSWSF